jgi:hypothetical protein
MNESILDLAISVARRQLLFSNLPSELTKGLRDELKEDRDTLIKALRNEQTRLAKKLEGQ